MKIKLDNLESDCCEDTLSTQISIEELEVDLSSKLAIVKSIMMIVIPSCLTLFMSEMVWQINIVYVGQLNDEAMLGGIGMANSLCCSIPLAITYGISGVLETLVS